MVTQEKQASTEKAPRGGRGSVVKALLGLVVLGLMGSYVLSGVSFETPLRATTAPQGERVRRETKPTLSPTLFVGKAASAHQIAQEIPDILDHLYCYCECDKHQGHKSLLSCYTDGHAAT